MTGGVRGTTVPGPARFRRRRVIRVIAIALVMLVHGCGRYEMAQSTPYAMRHFYSRDYHVALGIVLGRGFQLLRLDTPASAPLLDFCDMKTQRLDPADLAAWDRADRLRPADEPDSRNIKQRNELSRTFDMYVAGALWSVFGIDWRVHTAFYAGVSVLCGLLIYFITRRLSGSFGCGILAMILYAVSPYETRYTIESIRDISPLWSTVIAYWAVLCLADRFRSMPANAASYVATGVAASVGLGWRPDVAMLGPVMLTTLLAAMFWNRRGWKRILLAAVLFAAGAKGTTTLIRSILPDDVPDVGTFQILHVAYYADATRSNILDCENSFQCLRHDSYVYTLARDLYDHDPVEQRPEWDLSLYGRTYSDLMVRLFRDMGQYHLYDWAVALPRIAIRALGDAADPDRAHFARFHWWLPWAALLGGVAGLFVYRRHAPAVLSLFTFWIFYATIFLVVLPEAKHLAPFVMPLIVLGALGLWLPVRLVAGRPAADVRFESPLRFRRSWVLGTALLVTLVVAGSLVAAHRLARAKRQEYLSAVANALPTAVNDDATILDPRVFAATVEFSGDEQHGYLLDIVAGDRAGDLLLRHRPDPEGNAVAFENRHTLVPGAAQHYFFSCYRGWLPFGNRTSRYTVRLTGDSRIVGVRRLDLGAWRRLPFATVFTDDDAHAGSPRLDTGPAVRFVDMSTESFDERGLTFTESLVTSLGPASRLLAAADDPRCRVAPVAGIESRALDSETDTKAGTWIRTPREASRYVAMFGVFEAPERGRYVFRLATRTETGDYAFGLLSGDQSRWMTLAGTIRDVVAGGEARVILCDLEDGEQVVPTITNTADARVSEYVVRGLEIRVLEAP